MIETDDELKKALVNKLTKIINKIPISLEMLNIRSSKDSFSISWTEKKEDPK